jgi:hypothetical protein
MKMLSKRSTQLFIQFKTNHLILSQHMRQRLEITMICGMGIRLRKPVGHERTHRNWVSLKPIG